MSRKNKGHQQSRRERKRRQELLDRRAHASRAGAILDRAVDLIERGQWRDAREILEERAEDDAAPSDILELLLDVCVEQRDFGPACAVCRRLLERNPRDRELRLMLASGYIASAQPVRALLEFRRLLEQWPEDPLADGIRESVAQLEIVVDELLEDVPFPADKKLELAALHEESLACLADGAFEQVVRLDEQLLSHCADFLPAMNNLSEAYFREGRTDEAIAMSRRALEIDPDNFHALANLSRRLLLAGQRSEAEAMHERLRSVDSDRAEIWCKKAETFSYFGEDQAVLDALEGARRAGYTKDKTPDIAFLHHLAAVAAARLGDEKKAQRYWRKALDFHPSLTLAEDNLADARLPIAERHGPWPYHLDYWLTRDMTDRLTAALEHATQGGADEAVGQSLRRFAEENPGVASLVPMLLDRGDGPGREFAWRIAMLVGTPEMFHVLREFCFSRRGPDAMRMQTAERLSEEGLLPSGPVRMWLSGEWRDIELFGLEITTEPTGVVHTGQVEKWASAGLEALRDSYGEAAEKLFKRCIDRAGETPDLLNNLAAAYDIQGRIEESRELLRRVHERWPDYLFGCIAMARLATQEGDYALAESYLTPLRQRRRLHHTEFRALVITYIDLFLAQRNYDSARSWLALWKDIDPDSPDIAQFELLCSAPKPRGLLRNLLGRKSK